MSLSVCCASANPGRAAAALATLRASADEVLVAIDVSGGEQDLAPLLSVADRVFEIELEGFPEPALAWLHEQCSGEWIMRLDDDEVPSATLLGELPELLRARDVVQYWLARRWLFPDRERWLQAWPWFPDFQGRLVRNDPQIFFPGLCHSTIALVRPARYLESALYHAPHLLANRAQREERVRRYLALESSLRVTTTDPHLWSYYLPEHDSRALEAAVAVDPEDRPMIEALLTPAPEPRNSRNSEPPAAPVRRAGREEVRARWAASDLDEGAYRASIRAIDRHRRLIAGEHRPFRVRVRNEGDAWWPGGEDRLPLIRVAYRWLNPQGETTEREGIRTALPQSLAPGESCLLAMNVTAPVQPGPYTLRADLVHEGVRWFECECDPVEMLVSGVGSQRR